MYLILTISGICYTIYLYSYQPLIFNHFFNNINSSLNSCIDIFTNNDIIHNNMTENNTIKPDEHTDLEEGISEEYEIIEFDTNGNEIKKNIIKKNSQTQQCQHDNITNDEYDTSGSTDFVQCIPITTRFYSFK